MTISRTKLHSRGMPRRDIRQSLRHDGKDKDDTFLNSHNAHFFDKKFDLIKIVFNFVGTKQSNYET